MLEIRRLRRLAVLLAAAVLLPGESVAQEPPARSTPPPNRCQLGQVAELKVQVEQNQPLLSGKVNGQPVRMLVDTGASSTILLTAAARRLGVPLTEAPQYRVGGAGGMSAAYMGLLKTWDMEGVQRRDFRILVAGEGTGGRFDMIVGQDFLAPFDLEFDMRHGVVRLLKVSGCKGEDLPYWAKGAYSQVDLRMDRSGKLEVQPKLNGRAAMAILDTGATRSVGTPQAAARAGVKLEDTGERGRGIGGVTRVSSRGVLETFQLGDEVIRNTPLRFSDLFFGTSMTSTGSHISEQLMTTEMLLGMDFLMSHHVLVSRTNKLMVFTYEGGPVFDTTRPPESAAAAAPVAPPGAKPPS